MLIKRQTVRRPLSMTSLIDVIFLLLLFFMLTSTFSKFSEIEIKTANAGSGSVDPGALLFVQLDAGQISLNGQQDELEAILTRIREQTEDGKKTVVLSIRENTSSQEFVDVLRPLEEMETLALWFWGSDGCFD